MINFPSRGKLKNFAPVFHICIADDNGKNYVPAEKGKLEIIKDYEAFKFFSHFDGGEGWKVSEVSTGLLIGRGKTRREAVENTHKKLKETTFTCAQMLALLEERIKNGNKAPEPLWSAQWVCHDGIFTMVFDEEFYKLVKEESKTGFLTFKDLPPNVSVV